MLRRRVLVGIILIGVVANMVSFAVVDAAYRVPPRSTITPSSQMFGERRISVPSGHYAFGSGWQVMSPDLAHVVVKSTNDLTIGPGEDVVPAGGGIFDLVAGRINRITCPGCFIVYGVTPDGSAVIGYTAVKAVPEDVDNAHDLYLFDEAGPHLISTGGSALPTFVEMTPNADFVVFSISASLVPGDTDVDVDLYRWSRSSGALNLVSEGPVPTTPVFRAISPDGSRIAWESGLPATLFVWTSAGVTAMGQGNYADATPDLSRVYFNSPIALDPADHDQEVDGYVNDSTGNHVLTEPSAEWATVSAARDDGHAWVVITRTVLTIQDHDTEYDAYVVRPTGPVLISQGDAALDGLQIDGNLESAAYQTPARLDPNDTDDWDDVYRWTIEAPNEAQLVSGTEAKLMTLVAIADDGSRILMSSWEPQLPEDTDPWLDLYESVNGQLAMVIPGDGAFTVRGWSPDLKRVVVSATTLTSEDTNGGSFDVYISDADLTPPTPVVAVPGGFTGTSVEVTFGTQPEEGVWYDCRVDSGTWDHCSSPYEIDGLAGGIHDVSIRAFDAAGNSAEASAQLTTDATKPTVAGLRAGILTGSGFASTRAVPTRLSWTGSDTESGVSHYNAQRSVDDGAWTTIGGNISPAGVSTSLAPGYSYRFRVRAVDKVGNVGNWRELARFSTVLAEESSSGIAYAGKWSIVKSSSMSGGALRKSTAVGASATLAFTGTAVAWVAAKGPTFGKVKVYLDGVYVQTVDLYRSSALSRQIVFSRGLTTGGQHEVRLVNLATSGHAGISVDAFLSLERPVAGGVEVHR